MSISPSIRISNTSCRFQFLGPLLFIAFVTFNVFSNVVSEDPHIALALDSARGESNVGAGFGVIGNSVRCNQAHSRGQYYAPYSVVSSGD